MASHTAAAPAQSAWLSRFNGPVLHRTVSFGSPLVQHLFRRSFEHVGRNVHMVSVFGRVLLGEDKINEAEAAIYKRIEETMTAIERKVAQSNEAIKHAKLDTNLAAYNRPIELSADIVVPAQTKFIKLLELCDRYAQNFFTLWLAGEIEDKEKSRLEFDLKKLMRAIPATTRKMRLIIQEKLNESDHEEAKRDAAALVAGLGDEEIDDDDAIAAAEAAAAGKNEKGKSKGKSKGSKAETATSAEPPVASEASSQPEELIAA